MNETQERINDLVNSGTPENIELASMLFESQGINFEELACVQHYAPVIKWLSNYLDGYNEIKEGLANAINLKVLFLDDKNITSLPESFYTLTNLGFVFLRGNKLVNISDSIGELKNLIHIDLQDNSIERIPDSMGELNSLRHINLWGNKLTNLKVLRNGIV